MRINEEVAFGLIFVSAILTALAVLIGIGTWLGKRECETRWADSGMAVRWGFFEGCQLRKADGTWIPSSVYREVVKR
jgi:hypothetical protein